MNRAAPPTCEREIESRRAATVSLQAGRGWSAVGRLVSEPLVLFFILSAALWSIHAHFQARPQSSRITISKALTVQLAEHYRQQYGAPPSASELDALIDTAITEEISYRQAIKLGLDQGDEIVRRRLIQKYEFLQQDLAIPPDPTDNEAKDFYSHHLERYGVPERLTFTHVYFSPDRRGAAGARDAAAALAAALNLRGVTRAPNEGDPYPGPADFVAVTPAEIARVFGRDGLSEDIVTVQTGHWSPPLKSGFGWHSVYLMDRKPGRRAEFDDVRDQVTVDFIEAERARRNAAAMAALRSQFEVVRE